MSDWQKSGSFSTVTPVQPINGVPCVKKELKEEMFDKDPKNFDRFRQEFEILQNINHPNVIQVFEIQGSSYIMERADCDLETYVKENDLSTEEMDQIIDGISAGLGCLHEHNVIHRDLKPSNVLMINRVPKIADLGVCKPLNNQFLQTSAYSKGTMGSIRYMCNAHMNGEDPTFYFDIFAFGRLIYFMEKQNHPPIGSLDVFNNLRYQELIRATETKNAVPDINAFNQIRERIKSSYLAEKAIIQFVNGQIRMKSFVSIFSIAPKTQELLYLLDNKADNVLDSIEHGDTQSLLMFSNLYIDFANYLADPEENSTRFRRMTEIILAVLMKTDDKELRRSLFLQAYEWSYGFGQIKAISEMRSFFNNNRELNNEFLKYLSSADYTNKEISDFLKDIVTSIEWEQDNILRSKQLSGGSERMIHLTGSVGTGDKILEYWELFRCVLNNELSEGDFFAYRVTFGNQSGFFNYTLRNGLVHDANLDVTGFQRTLGSNNDSSLIRLAERVHRNY